MAPSSHLKYGDVIFQYYTTYGYLTAIISIIRL